MPRQTLVATCSGTLKAPGIAPGKTMISLNLGLRVMMNLSKTFTSKTLILRGIRKCWDILLCLIKSLSD